MEKDITIKRIFWEESKHAFYILLIPIVAPIILYLVFGIYQAIINTQIGLISSSLSAAILIVLFLLLFLFPFLIAYYVLSFGFLFFLKKIYNIKVLLKEKSVTFKILSKVFHSTASLAIFIYGYYGAVVMTAFGSSPDYNTSWLLTLVFIMVGITILRVYSFLFYFTHKNIIKILNILLWLLSIVVFVLFFIEYNSFYVHIISTIALALMLVYNIYHSLKI